MQFYQLQFSMTSDDWAYTVTGRLKMRDMNLRQQFARVEITGHENAGPICRGGKCEKKLVWKAKV